MNCTTKGRVTGIISDQDELQEIWVQSDNAERSERAYNYPALYRRLEIGDAVWLNTTAVKLGLGTGGRHFVIPEGESAGFTVHAGHIMKLRYTPWQFSILAAEEETSPYHSELVEADSLEGTPVIAAPLHSMLPGIIAGFKKTMPRETKIAYVMTDGAALPIALSNLVRDLKQKQLLDLTVTAGQAFGGDLEAVGIPSAMLAAKQAVNADLIIVALGPGIVGTGTKMGFSGIEQSWVLDLAGSLNGIPVAVPRMSAADLRLRHQGISHHSQTILTLVNKAVKLPFSNLLPSEFQQQVIAQLTETNLLQRHEWYYTDEPAAQSVLQEYQLQVSSMGRNLEQDPVFFQTTVAAGFLAAKLLLGSDGALERVVNVD